MKQVKQLVLRGWLILSLIFFATSSQANGPANPPANEPMTMVNFAKELIRNDIDHWKVVLAQGIVEAGWKFDSNVFRNSNNFIGMRIPGNRPSTRIGEYNGYSKYATWQDCVKDVKYWQEQNWKGGTQAEYIDMMQRIWAESPDYKEFLYMVIAKIEKIEKQLKEKHKNHFNYNLILAYLSE